MTSATPGQAPGDGHGAGHHGRTTKESAQDIVISVIIAFALAFVFRGFVVEAFVIPTGSMAPTLMGAHERVISPETGYSWPVGPWQSTGPNSSNYLPIQKDIAVHDPMSGVLIREKSLPRRSGDRILVLKYLYAVFEPTRFDVVVFKHKDPYQSEVNYIKRLVGLPGEEIALVDGDVFFRRHEDKNAKGGPDESGSSNRWGEPGWQVARKSAVVQQAIWQKVFDSDFAPRNPIRDGKVTSVPWVSAEPGWTISGREYTYEGLERTELAWDSTLLRYRSTERSMPSEDPWELDDRYPYDEAAANGFQGAYSPKFPVSDLRLSAGIRPTAPGLRALATIQARSHEFQMELDGKDAILRMRPQPRSGETPPEWTEVARTPAHTLVSGEVTNAAFVHSDQRLEAWLDGERLCSYEYNWSPEQRIEFATGKTVAQLQAEERTHGEHIYAQVGIYQKPRVWWTFEGAPLKLYRVGIDRDIYYQPGPGNGDVIARSSRPESPMILNDNQFFVCGDNSPASSDARLWGPPEPFVREIDPTEGIVPRKLMLGRAFFVYFPALHEESRVPVPDFGRMRFIW